jgi:hypothetical protein
MLAAIMKRLPSAVTVVHSSAFRHSAFCLRSLQPSWCIRQLVHQLAQRWLTIQAVNDQHLIILDRSQ